MNSLKLIIPVLCMIPLSVYGGGTPADILGGQLRTLKQKILNRSINQEDAQKTFTQLTNAIPPQKLNSYQGIINQTINEAKKRGIFLTIKEASAYTKAPADMPKPIEPPQKTTTIAQPIKKDTPVLPAILGGSKKPQQPTDETKTQKPTDYTEKKHPGEADQAIPREKLTDAQFNELKNKLKNLKKNHTLMNPNEIDATLNSIRVGFGNVPIPLYMQKIMARIEKFKTQLNNDLNTIVTIGNKLIDSELPSMKNKLTDPKVIKGLVLKAHAIEKEIEPYETAYPANNAIQSAALEATTKTLYDNVYAIMQESMKQAAQLKDTALLNKLIRAYTFVATAYPVYSKKRTERDVQAKIQKELTLLEQQEKEKQDKSIKNKIAQIIKQLETNDHYTRIEPEKVDAQLIVLEDNFDLLTDEQKELLSHIDMYQVYVYETIDRMKPIDADLLATQKTLKKKDVDIATINTALKTIRTLNKTWKQELHESIENSWINITLAQFVKVIEETYKAVSTKEKELFDTLITNTKQFIAQNPTDPEEVYNKEDALDIIRKQYNKEYNEADPIRDEAYRKELNQKIDSIDTLAEQLLHVRDELEKKMQEQEELGRANREEELAFIQQESEKLEKQNLSTGTVPFTENPSLRALDTKKLPASPGYEKVKSEAEESTQRLLELGEQRRQKEAFEAQQKAQESQRQKNLIRSDL